MKIFTAIIAYFYLVLGCVSGILAIVAPTMEGTASNLKTATVYLMISFLGQIMVHHLEWKKK